MIVTKHIDNQSLIRGHCKSVIKGKTVSVHWFKNHSCSCKHDKNVLCGKVYPPPVLKTVLEAKLLSTFVLLLLLYTTTTITSTTYWEILLEQKA